MLSAVNRAIHRPIRPTGLLYAFLHCFHRTRAVYCEDSFFPATIFDRLRFTVSLRFGFEIVF